MPLADSSPAPDTKSRASTPTHDAVAPAKPAAAVPVKPVTDKPVTSKPATAKPEAAKPEAGKPEAGKPVTPQPVVTEPGTAWPDVAGRRPEAAAIAALANQPLVTSKPAATTARTAVSTPTAGASSPVTATAGAPRTARSKAATPVDVPAAAGTVAPPTYAAPADDDRFWSTDRVDDPEARSRRRRLAFVAAAVILAGLGNGYAITHSRGSGDDAQVLGERLSNPPAATPPQASTANATVDASGQIRVTETRVWSDAVPATIDVEQPNLQGLAGIPDDVLVAVGLPSATLDGQALAVSAADNGAWRLTVPDGVGPGAVVIDYPLTGVLHNDPASAPGRALAVVALPPLASTADVPRQVTLPAKGVLNVSCPTPDNGPVTLCATREDATWVVTLPLGGSVVLAQLDQTG